MIPLMPSPGRPKIVSTPHSMRRSISASPAILRMVLHSPAASHRADCSAYPNHPRARRFMHTHRLGRATFGRAATPGSRSDMTSVEARGAAHATWESEIPRRVRTSLRDYAFLGDGHRGALSARQGDVAWMCFPGWADAAVFAALSAQAGTTPFSPRAAGCGAATTRTARSSGQAAGSPRPGASSRERRSPTRATRDRALLLRRVRAIDAPGRLNVCLDLRRDYGRATLTNLRRGDGHWELRGPDLVARWWGAQDAQVRHVAGPPQARAAARPRTGRRA